MFGSRNLLSGKGKYFFGSILLFYFCGLSINTIASIDHIDYNFSTICKSVRWNFSISSTTSNNSFK
jgi:hypothetical protein